MSSAKVPPSDFKGTVKVGITTGLVAGVALFAVFLSIDQQLGLTNGLFFKTMIAAFGVEPILAIFIGLCASAIIGTCYNLVSDNWNTFRIITAPKGILTGAVAGAIVFALIFVPLHTLVFVPAVESNVFLNDSADFSSEEIMNERKNKFLKIGRNKGFMSSPEDLSSLTVKNNNFDKILKSKKVLIGSIIAGLVLLVAVFSLI
mgnify:CR=1 FL=1